PRTGLAFETGANLRIADGFKDAAGPASLGDGCEVAPGEPAPRRVQHREPRDIVGRVQQRTRQADQVLHGLTLAERLDLDGVDREPALTEPLLQAAEMCAALHEHRHAERRMLATLALDDIDGD